jgi:uncharacterized damage-inducible protein DinB
MEPAAGSSALQLTIEELFAYTEGERARWAEWFAAHGDESLRLKLSPESQTTIGALILHVFGPELQYAEFLSDEPISDYADTPDAEAAAIFAFGRRSRAKLRGWASAARPEDWLRIFEPQDGVSVTARKIVLHVLFHEVRHWAQIAIAVRGHGWPPPGNHDLLFSDALA